MSYSRDFFSAVIIIAQIPVLSSNLD